MCLKYVITLVLAFFLGCLSIYGQDLENLRNELRDSDTNKRLEASWDLFRYYRTINRDSALIFASLNNSISIEKKDTLAIVRSYNAIGYLHKEDGDFVKSIENYKRGLVLAKERHYDDQVKYLLNNLAIVYTYYGQYDKSLDCHFQSLKIRESENNLLDISISYNNIGLVYYKIGDNEKALKYFLKSLNLKRENKIDHEIERNLINIGLAYIGLEDFQNALSTYQELIGICNTGCSDQIALETYSGAGLAYFKANQFDDSEKMLLKSLSKAKKQNDHLYQVVAYYYLAKISYEKGETEKSLEQLGLANETVDFTDAQEWKMEIDNLYSQLYGRLGKYELAYFYQNRYSTHKDSIFNEELIKNLANIQLDFQEQQTQEIIDNKDFQINRRGQINLLLGGITLLISALLIILYKNIQLKKKANRKLAEANNIIEHQNKELTNINTILEDRVRERTKELKKANVALTKSNEELDNFIYKTSHDIRGPLATLMGVCNIAQIDVKDKQALDYFDKLSITAKRLNEILSKLLTINQINNSALQLERIDLQALINDLVVEGRSQYGNPKIEVDIDIAPNLRLKSDFELIRVIYGNLIANAIKFRDTSDRRQSNINLTLTESAKWVVFCVVDNGIGISETESEKIFEVFSKATDIADSSGIGLYLVKLAVEKLQGNIIHGKTDKGWTYFEVKLPK